MPSKPFKEVTDAVAEIISRERTRVIAHVEQANQAVQSQFSDAVAAQDAKSDEALSLADDAIQVSNTMGAEVMQALESAVQDAKDVAVDAVSYELKIAALDSELWKELTKKEIEETRVRADELQAALDLANENIQQTQALNKALADQLEKANNQRLKHLGPYVPGQEYTQGDCVMRDGATFWCVQETSADPREKASPPTWRILAMRGEKGTPGEKGSPGDVGARGLRGSKGNAGTPGVDGAGLVDVQVVGPVIALAMSDGSAYRVDLSKAIDSIVSEKVAAEIKRAAPGQLEHL